MLRITRYLVLASISWSVLAQEPGWAQAGESPEPPESEIVYGEDWPCFRGPGGMGVSTATGLPLEWDATTNVAWKTPLPGSGASSPIVLGDRIYLTCYTGYFVPGEPEGSREQLERHLLALDVETGEIAWDRAVAAKLPEETSIRDHGFAANTPAADAERVYAFFGKTGVFAFDHEGKRLWQADVGTETHGWGTSASPVLYRDLVFINASVESASLVALDRSTGEELVVARKGDVLAFEPETGKRLWSCETDIEWYMVPTAVAADGVVYFLGGRSGTAALAVRAGGSGDVTATHRLWTSESGSNVTSPILHDGHLFWMNDKRGIAYCARAESGEVIYEERLKGMGQVYASPVLADGRLYYLDRHGKTAVLAARPEFEQLALNQLEDRSRFDASPAVAGERLLIRSGKFLYCLGK